MAVDSNNRFVSLCERLRSGCGGHATAVHFGVQALYQHPPRAYHNLSHVENLLSVFDEARHVAEHAEAVEFAIWFHDCVYVPGRSDNEELSADVAVVIGRGLGVEEAVVESVREMVLATKHIAPAGTYDARLTADIDLSVLAIPRAAYRENSAKIRTEFSFADDAAFNAGRLQFIEAFLAKPSIYQTDYFRERCEAAARENLAAERERLG